MMLDEDIIKCILRIVGEYVGHYNNVRLNSVIGCITPKAKLEGREKEIFKKCDKKLEAA